MGCYDMKGYAKSSEVAQAASATYSMVEEYGLDPMEPLRPTSNETYILP